MTATAARAPLAAADPRRETVRRRFALSTEVPTRFFEAEADAISIACLAMARRFLRGGRLLVFGEGPEATDAQHVAVEFVHPVLVGKRALPAIALTSDVAALTGASRVAAPADGFARVLATLGRPVDVAMAISRDGEGDAVVRGLARARAIAMLTIALAGDTGGRLVGIAEHAFVVPANDPLVVQEVHETLYHVLWELVHVFFEHRVAE